jgi:hypothetical protein
MRLMLITVTFDGGLVHDALGFDDEMTRFLRAVREATVSCGRAHGVLHVIVSGSYRLQAEHPRGFVRLLEHVAFLERLGREGCDAFEVVLQLQEEADARHSGTVLRVELDDDSGAWVSPKRGSA